MRDRALRPVSYRCVRESMPSQPFRVDEAVLRGPYCSATSAWTRVKIASSIACVSLPVLVFWRLG
jgi:hypothetical protein